MQQEYAISDFDRQKWDAKYRQQAPVERAPEPFLVEQDSRLPRRGRALDVAGGSGRNALWLARRGLDVTLLDISTVALEKAGEAARSAGLPVTTIAADLDLDPLPAGPWDVIVSCQFLWRPLFAAAQQYLSPGGWLVYVQPTQRNLERNASPAAKYLLEEGELPRICGGLEIIHYHEAWRSSGRHEAWLLARKVEAAHPNE